MSCINNNQNTEKQVDKVIKIEVVYHPGPLEKLFGQIGKCFDAIFNQKGNKLNAPIRKNKSVNKLNVILSAADL